jgi:two-component system sensor histidine kinase/response regulator
MNDHVAKPIDPSALFETVGRFYKAPASVTLPEVPRQGVTPGAPGLPVVSGLDTSDGLARVGGNEKLYRKLLRDFAEQQHRAVDQIDDALAASDVAHAERLAHTLKGVAGNLGAKDIQARAGTLEKLIRERADINHVEQARREVASLLEPMTAALRGALGAAVVDTSAAFTPPVDPGRVRQAGEQLRALLSESDPGAGDFVDANRDALRPLFDAAAWPEFEQLVQGYAFADAQARLESALEAAARRH